MAVSCDKNLLQQSPLVLLWSHLVVVFVAWGGDIAMYSEDPPAAAAEGTTTGLAFDTREEY